MWLAFSEGVMLLLIQHDQALDKQKPELPSLYPH